MARAFCVLLAEPNRLLAEKGAGVVSRHDEVWCVSQVSSSFGLTRAAQALQPDLVLADLGLLQPSGTVCALRERSPRSRVVALVDAASEPYVSAALRLGVDEVIEKSHLSEGLQRELRPVDDDAVIDESGSLLMRH